VPLGPKDPAKRVAAVRRALDGLATEPGLTMTEPLAGLFSLLPPSVLVPALRAQVRTVDFATSIVPGLRSSRFMAGAPVEASWPMGPRVGCAVNFTVLTCDDRLHLGVNLDPAAVTDPAALMECLAESFADLLEAGAGGQGAGKTGRPGIMGVTTAASSQPPAVPGRRFFRARTHRRRREVP